MVKSRSYLKDSNDLMRWANQQTKLLIGQQRDYVIIKLSLQAGSRESLLLTSKPYYETSRLPVQREVRDSSGRFVLTMIDIKGVDWEFEPLTQLLILLGNMFSEKVSAGASNVHHSPLYHYIAVYLPRHHGLRKGPSLLGRHELTTRATTGPRVPGPRTLRVKALTSDHATARSSHKVRNPVSALTSPLI